MKDSAYPRSAANAGFEVRARQKRAHRGDPAQAQSSFRKINRLDSDRRAVTQDSPYANWPLLPSPNVGGLGTTAFVRQCSSMSSASLGFGTPLVDSPKLASVRSHGLIVKGTAFESLPLQTV